MSARHVARSEESPWANLGVHLMLLTAILPSAHQDGPPASSHNTAQSCAESESVDASRGPIRLTLRRIEVQIKPLDEEKVGFPYEPIKDEVNYDDTLECLGTWGSFGGVSWSLRFPLRFFQEVLSNKTISSKS